MSLQKLRALFGPSRREMWRLLAQTIDADHVERGFVKGDAVVARTGDWQITLDLVTESSGNSSVTYTRMRAPYVNDEGLRFTVYREGFFTPLGKKLGLVQDLEVGDEAFDRAFVVQGNDEARIRELLSSSAIKLLMHKQPRFRITVKDDEGFFGDDYGYEVDLLEFRVAEVIKDVPRLHALFDLFALLLDELCARGRAYEDKADVGSRLPAETSVALREVFAVVEAATHSFEGRPERVGQAIEAHLELDAPPGMRGRLRVTEPALPADTCDVWLAGDLPVGDAEAPGLERRLGETGAKESRVTWGDSGVELQLEGVSRYGLTAALATALDLWSFAATTRAGT
jgi:hypothetical protein